MTPEIRTIASSVVYADDWIRLRKDDIERRDGSRGTYAVVERGDEAAAAGLLEFNADRVVAVLVDVLDTMRALGFHPPHAHAGLGSGAWLGLEQQRAALVIPDPGRLVDDHYAHRPVRVLGFACSWLDHHLQHPHPVVFQHEPM